jgi:hypothetical protein
MISILYMTKKVRIIRMAIVRVTILTVKEAQFKIGPWKML